MTADFPAILLVQSLSGYNAVMCQTCTSVFKLIYICLWLYSLLYTFVYVEIYACMECMRARVCCVNGFHLTAGNNAFVR